MTSDSEPRRRSTYVRSAKTQHGYDRASLVAISTALLTAGAAAAQTQTSSAPTPLAATAQSATSTIPQAAPSGNGAVQAPAGTGPAVAEIVVTAQKRTERLQDVPISISVVSPALLASTNSKNFTELSGAVPGIQFYGNGGGGRTYVTLRGTSGSALNTGDEPVAIYMDDVYLARGEVIGTEDLLDPGSIEILRGPQGTLQGRNATAGAILIRSADPTSTPQGYITSELDDPLEFRAQGAVSGPLGDGFEGRLAASYVNAQGWGKNTFNDTHIGGDESEQARGVLTYSGDNPLTARIVADYATITNTPALFRDAATTFSPLSTGPLVTTPTPTTSLPAVQHNAIYNDNDYSLYPNTRTTVNTDGLSAKLAYAFPGIDLVSISGYRRTRAFGTNNSEGLATPPREGLNHNDDRSSELSQETRLQSSGKARFSWIVGFYYFNEYQTYADTIYNLKVTVPADTASLYFGKQQTTSYSGFGDGTYNILDNLQLIGGIRYSNDKKHLVGGIAVTNQDTNVVTTTPYILSGQTTSPQHSWSDVTYRVKLVYHPIPNLMLYAGYGTGFRAGGFNDFAVQAPFSPETNASFEAGTKGDFFERKLSVSLTGYHNDYDNLQLRAGVPSGGAIITNAAKAVINGFELELNARPFERTRLSANAAYTDATFSSFPAAVDIFSHFVDASGNSLPNSPKWQFFLSAAQDFPVSDRWLLTAEANYRWRDTIYFYFTNQDAASLRDGPGGSLNTRVSLKDNSGKWTVSAFINNLTDARIVSTDVVTFSYPEVGLNEPRVFGISAERHF